MSVSIEQSGVSQSREIEHYLLEDLGRNSEQSKNSSFTLIAKSENGALIGGLSASTSYGWLLIKVLWVCETQRKNGIGSKLVKEAEGRARQLDCHAAWLDTSNPCARLFYEKQGYEEFGKLENVAGQVTETHRRWFLKKALD